MKKINVMCINCAQYSKECGGTSCQTWTGCIYHKPTTPEAIAALPLEKLVELFEFTTNIDSPHIYTVRGWLMDAIEEKNPNGCDAWLSLDAPEDNELRQYVL